MDFAEIRAAMARIKTLTAEVLANCKNVDTLLHSLQVVDVVKAADILARNDKMLVEIADLSDRVADRVADRV